MLSEEPKLNDSEAINDQPSSGDHEVSPQPLQTAAAPAPQTEATIITSQADDEEESRSSGDVDFGQLLDQFEQEQATLQEGEVVRGIVVGISERGVVIDFGYKSEGIVNPAEFTENGEIMVKPGDEVDVLVKNMETADGLPILSRADAVRMKAWDDLEKKHIRTGPPLRDELSSVSRADFASTSMASGHFFLVPRLMCDLFAISTVCAIRKLKQR